MYFDTIGDINAPVDSDCENGDDGGDKDGIGDNIIGGLDDGSSDDPDHLDYDTGDDGDAQR